MQAAARLAKRGSGYFQHSRTGSKAGSDNEQQQGSSNAVEDGSGLRQATLEKQAKEVTAGDAGEAPSGAADNNNNSNNSELDMLNIYLSLLSDTLFPASFSPCLSPRVSSHRWNWTTPTSHRTIILDCQQ